MIKPKFLRQVLSRLALALMGVLIALALAELGVGWLGSPFEPKQNEMHQCDRLTGWRGKANTTTILNSNGYEHRVVRNSQGMHDDEHAQEKAPGVFRIMVLGDSFVEATEVEEQQSSHAILEERLNALASSQIKFEVISAGIHAWGPAQELMYFRSEGRLFQPDLLLILWVPANDLSNILPDHALTVDGINCYASYFAICDDRFDPQPWFSAPGVSPTWQSCSLIKKWLTGSLNQFYTHSRLYQWLAAKLAKRYKVKYAHPYAPWLERESSDVVLRYAFQLTANIYSQLADEGSKIGAKTAFVIVPFSQAIYSEVDSNYREILQTQVPGLEEAKPTLPNRVFSELMGAKGLLSLDLHARFAAYLKEKHEDLHWSGDIHWNVLGNRVAAESITDWLIAQNLVPLNKTLY